MLLLLLFVQIMDKCVEHSSFGEMMHIICSSHTIRSAESEDDAVPEENEDDVIEEDTKEIIIIKRNMMN